LTAFARRPSIDASSIHRSDIPRWIEYTLVSVAAFLALALIGLIALVHTLDLNRYVKLAIEEVKRTTGREFGSEANWR